VKRALSILYFKDKPRDRNHYKYDEKFEKQAIVYMILLKIPQLQRKVFDIKYKIHNIKCISNTKRILST